MSMFIYKIQNAQILWYNGTRLCNYKAIVKIYGIYISCEIGVKVSIKMSCIYWPISCKCLWILIPVIKLLLHEYEGCLRILDTPWLLFMTGRHNKAIWTHCEPVLSPEFVVYLCGTMGVSLINSSTIKENNTPPPKKNNNKLSFSSRSHARNPYITKVI